MRVILKRPLVTEKMTNLQDQRQYAFEVDLKANKVEIAKAVEKKFNVTVESVERCAAEESRRSSLLGEEGFPGGEQTGRKRWSP